MKRLVKAFSILCLVFVLPISTSFGMDNPSESVIEAAEDGLEKYSKDLMDLAPVKNTEDLSLGFAFQVFTVTPDVLLNSKESDLSVMSVPTDMWRFIVNQKGNPVALLTVAKVNGIWDAVMFGSYELALEVNQMHSSYAKQRGVEFQYIRIFQATSDILSVKQAGKTLGFAPLQSAQRSLNLVKGASDQSLMQGEELITSLKNVVSERLTQEQSLF